MTGGYVQAYPGCRTQPSRYCGDCDINSVLWSCQRDSDIIAPRFLLPGTVSKV